MSAAGFAFVFGLFLGLLAKFAKRTTYTDWERAINQSDARRLCRAISSTDICERLARHLEIEHDGGIPAAEFVEYAIRECWRDVDGGNINSKTKMPKTAQPAEGESK